MCSQCVAGQLLVLGGLLCAEAVNVLLEPVAWRKVQQGQQQQVGNGAGRLSLAPAVAACRTDIADASCPPLLPMLKSSV